MKVFISAGEASADRHGASLLRALRAEISPSVRLQAYGMGGEALKKEGLQCIVDSREVAVMGFSSVVFRLPRIVRAWFRLLRELKKNPPDVLVLIDHADFHMLLARWAVWVAGCSTVPMYYFIPPKTWIWRRGRIRALQKYFRGLLCIFPFEIPFYRSHGVPADALFDVGNPLVDQLPLSLSQHEARSILRGGSDGTPEPAKRVVLMPGSRGSEIALHFSLFLDATWLAMRQEDHRSGATPVSIQGTHPRWQVTIPAAQEKDAALLREALAQWIREKIQLGQSVSGLDIEVTTQHAGVVLAAADAGIIKSGTSTLEAALMRCPHVVVYRYSKLTAWIIRVWVRFGGPAALSNLLGLPPESAILEQKVADRKTLLFPEHLGPHVALGAVTQDLLKILHTTPASSHFSSHSMRQNQLQRCEAIRAQLMRPSSPSETAARAIVSTYLKPRVRPKKSIAAASWLWQRVQQGRRYALKGGWIRPAQLPVRVIGVGNIQAGGAGKTPLIIQLASEGHRRGQQVAVLIRGYQGAWEKSGGVIPPRGSSDTLPHSDSHHVDPRLCGDEAALISEYCPYAWIGVGRNRVQSFEAIQKRATIDLVLMDDALQNTQIKKELDLIAMTSSTSRERVFREGGPLPGALRVWTKGEIRPEGTDVRVRLQIQPEQRALLAESPHWLVTSLGDAGEVMRTLEHAGMKSGSHVLRHTRLRDHQWPEHTQVMSLLSQAKTEGLALLMTGKDWMKWRAFSEARQAHEQGLIRVVEPSIEFLEGRDKWEAACWGN